MTTKQLTKLFKPFEQVGDVARRTEGRGLGLAISQQLVELMGGTIQVTSTPGQGSTFWFEAAFLASEIIAVPRSNQQGKIVGYTADRQLKLLVVDDKADIRLMLLHLLEPLGFNVTLAEDGQDGVNIVQAIHPTGILMDLMMPVMTGFEAVQILRQQPEFQQTPIIAMSASVFGMDQEQSWAAGCDAFLSRPIETHELFDLLARLLPIVWTYANTAMPSTMSTSITAILGYNPEEFIRDSRFWANHIHPDDAARVFAEFPRLFEQGAHTHEYRFLHKNGDWRWMRSELKLVRDVAGNPLEIIGVKGRPPSILIVDDHEDNRRLLHDMLAPLGFHLAEAENGQEALDQIAEFQPDLIFLDLKMPAMDGYEVLARLRAQDAASLPVLEHHDPAFAPFVRLFRELSNGFQLALMREKLDAFLNPLSPLDEAETHRLQAPWDVTADALHTLPEAWRLSLEHASLQGNLEAMESIITQIRTQNVSLSEGLAALSAEFEFSKILNLLHTHRSEEDAHNTKH